MEEFEVFLYKPKLVYYENIVDLYNELKSINENMGYVGSEVYTCESIKGYYIITLNNESIELPQYAIKMPYPDVDGNDYDFRDELLRPVIRLFMN